MVKFHQGRFKPRNPKKYVGDSTNIVYRSGLEFKFMMWLDSHPEILNWASEEVTVPYISPIDNRGHRYFPDFVFRTKNKTYMVEVKPSQETAQPILREGKSQRRFREESYTWLVNQAKWLAATDFCKDKGWQFKIMTEKDLYGMLVNGKR